MVDLKMFKVFLIAGGVGITPLISILRTMVDREDVRPVVLVYGNPDYERVIFRDQLDELRVQWNFDLKWPAFCVALF